jgi:hypothetical protein
VPLGDGYSLLVRAQPVSRANEFSVWAVMSSPCRWPSELLAGGHEISGTWWWAHLLG